ncbi:hypothetical protein MTO96_030022 [Rhipicephalus appendiculatus]
MPNSVGPRRTHTPDMVTADAHERLTPRASARVVPREGRFLPRCEANCPEWFAPEPNQRTVQRLLVPSPEGPKGRQGGLLTSTERGSTR